MGKRNLHKIIEGIKPKVQPHYDLEMAEWRELAILAEKKPCEAVGDAFLYGYAMGQRALKAGQKRKNPTSGATLAGQATNQEQ